MAAERVAPDALLVQSNLSGAVTAIDDDPDSPDASWLTYDGAGGNADCRVSFPTPSGGNPTTGASLQSFRVQIRKNASGGNATPWSLQLWEDGAQVAELATGTTTALAPNGEVVAGTWDASSLGTADGSLVECRLQQTGGGTSGSGANRRRIEIGAIEWNADVTAAAAVLTADAGSFALTGQAAATRVARKMAAAAGSFALTGQTAGLALGHTLSAAAGSFAVTGQAVAPRADRRLPSAAGTLTLTGQDAALTYAQASQSYTLVADAGSFALPGQAAALRADRKLSIATGTFAFAGQDATLTYAPAPGAYTLTAESGTFTITGQSVGLRAARKLAAAQASLALAGQAATLSRIYRLAAGHGSFVLNGQPASLTYSGGPPASNYEAVPNQSGQTCPPAAVYKPFPPFPPPSRSWPNMPQYTKGPP